MNKKILILIAGIAIITLFYCSATTLYRHIFSEEAMPLDEHIHLLEPFLEVIRPADIIGKTPVVVIVPGCLHTVSHNPSWHDLFLESGYAVVIMDSFTPRDLEGDALERVCSLLAVPGFDRAGDMYATVEYLRRQDWVDADRIALAGWSHGGWAVMDAMAFYEERKNPYNISGEIPNHLDGVSAIFIVYPHCGFGTAAHNGFLWSKRIPTLILIAGQDRGVDPEKCIKWHNKQENPNLRFTILENAEHTFDIPAPYNRDPVRFSEEYLREAMNMVRNLL